MQLDSKREKSMWSKQAVSGFVGRRQNDYCAFIITQNADSHFSAPFRKKVNELKKGQAIGWLGRAAITCPCLER